MTDSTRERLETALRECRNEFSQAFHKVMWPYLSEESKDHVAKVLSRADAALAASVAEPDGTREIDCHCIYPIPTTDGRCGNCAQPLAGFGMWLKYSNASDEIKHFARAVAEKAPAPPLPAENSESLTRWIWSRFVGCPAVEPYDHEYKQLFEHVEQLQRQWFTKGLHEGVAQGKSLAAEKAAPAAPPVHGWELQAAWAALEFDPMLTLEQWDAMAQLVCGGRGAATPLNEETKK